ncbi:3-deoxy-manno-octulosonate cytidylyltransferase [Aestuariirhabdus litorea]|uniref:3-deoxy-manno-octulosonate cytidylyltransferase n=1 Tax=Aestuariirhabdus litorea TaxID=2528527 RepID=A0A3P3VPN5_9GAMM|nr:3-deoxy-manno-octulosonate cytidylyltransferase [Aestuariirhabdus litorea]RRJ84685.1 3-deoxy-manno-octulosonate cytidylyltransferase [Aestuariirhabdus litorea]RWW97910.1 3-deoxy-manno-octulosonate cytidylyltransferase [Endozoicomonadaceae bacterium GTF-13]
MSFSVIIPARYASNRLPGKPLADIAGQTMIERVYRQAIQSSADRVIIATDHPDIEAAAHGFGAEVVMTSSDHPSGTDRLQQVAATLGFGDDQIVVNVQGDEPLIPPSLIDQVADNLANDPEASVATLCEPIREASELFNPNAVKVVMDARSHAIYFSRAALPWARDAFALCTQTLPETVPFNRHIGIYAYRVGLLNRFVHWGPSPLESIECLEQLRVLYHGDRIHVEQACETPPAGIDTPEDLERVRRLLSGH